METIPIKYAVDRCLTILHSGWAIQSRNILSIIIWTNMDKRAAPDSGIKTLLSERNVKIETTGVFLDENEAAFFAAVKSGDIKSVRSKLNDAVKRVSKDAINSDGKTALQIAAENNNVDMVKELLNNTVNKPDLYTALLQCVVKNDLGCIKKIFSEVPDDFKLGTALTIHAAQLRHYEIVYFLIQNGCLIHECERTCTTCKTESNGKECPDCKTEGDSKECPTCKTEIEIDKKKCPTCQNQSQKVSRARMHSRCTSITRNNKSLQGPYEPCLYVFEVSSNDSFKPVLHVGAKC